jgi:hypothetical protein
MSIKEAIKLQANDEVFWTDPDMGRCSRHYLISEIDIEDGVVKITEKDGSYLECNPDELS